MSVLGQLASQQGSVGDERGEVGHKGGHSAQPPLGSFGRRGSYLWPGRNLLLPARETGRLRKAVRACCLFILFSSLLWEAGMGLQRAACLLQQNDWGNWGIWSHDSGVC